MYEGFAGIYDRLMSDVPYREWVALAASLIREHGISEPVFAGGRGESASDALSEERNLVVDLGCGTGTATELLSDMGYDCIGVDVSPDMLSVAQRKNEGRERPIQYLCQDMRRLDLYCTAGTFVSLCDSVNYLLTDKDVLKCFAGVRRFLFPGGLFVFDFNTAYKYRDVIGSGTIAESGEAVSFIWENSFSARGNRNRAEITFFERCEDGRYRRFAETHVQRGFTLSEMRELIERAGLRVVAARDAETGGRAREKSERIMMAARKEG